MLIVEGPDGSGKTTLCQKLSQELEWPIAPRVVDQNTRISGGRNQLKDWVHENLAKGFHETIYDRHRLISEPIYGPIIRRTLQDGFDDAVWFMSRWNQLLTLQPVVIFCLPPLEDVVKNVDGDRLNIEVRGHIEEIYWLYWATYCRFPHPIRHDYTGPFWSVEQVARRVRSVQRRIEACQ